MDEHRDDSKRATPGPPRVWALLGHRTGDNMQVEALATALGWPWEPKRLAWRGRLLGWTPLYGRVPSLTPLTPEARRIMIPPWPDLVLSVGWRSVPVARWIARRSGARLVHIGRPRAPLDAFDLVLTTPQYRLPDAANVIQLEAPLTRLSPEVLRTAAERWRERFAGLPRPWVAVLIGGDAPPLRLTSEAATELARKVDVLVRSRGGSLLIATGPRTSRSAAEALFAGIGAPAYRYRWNEEGENPYLGFLALADEFVVTSDSISMAHEASLTGRPLHLFEVPSERANLRSPFKAALRIARGRPPEWLDRRLRKSEGWSSELYLELIRNGWISAPRAPYAYHSRLLRSGRAVRLGEPAMAAPKSSTAPETEPALVAIRNLFEP